MTAEIAVTIALAAIGGLCVLLWNTDGSVDWIGYVAGLCGCLLWVGLMIWDSACAILSFVGAAAAGPHGKAVQEAIQARAWGWDLIGGVALTSCASSVVPHIIRVARKARR